MPEQHRHLANKYKDVNLQGGGGILWRPPAYNLLLSMNVDVCFPHVIFCSAAGDRSASSGPMLYRYQPKMVRSRCC